jgi:hypothetical protein
MATNKQVPQSRTPDAFQRARQIYNARTRLFDKADQLLREADPHTKALVQAQEEADAQSVATSSESVDTSSTPQER